jgi:hypothetical protein
VPATEPIYRRNLVFRRTARPDQWWLRGDAVATAFYNALSATFPQGERFFMESVRRFRDVVSADVRASIDCFLFQEAVHAREHGTFNEEVNRSETVARLMEKRTKERLDLAREFHPIGQLALTAGFEHLTAIMAREWLTRPIHLEGSPPEVQRLWRWHAMEELEHKAVAFDTYVEVVSKLSPFRRWLIRSAVMLRGTMTFIWLVGGNMHDQLDAATGGRYKLRLLHFLFVRPGLIFKVLGGYFEYFLPWFHPRKRDDRLILDHVRHQFARDDA